MTHTHNTENPSQVQIKPFPERKSAALSNNKIKKEEKLRIIIIEQIPNIKTARKKRKKTERKNQAQEE